MALKIILFWKKWAKWIFVEFLTASISTIYVTSLANKNGGGR
jgi:hypothetical protein